MSDRNCLSNWFPKLALAGVPTTGIGRWTGEPCALMKMLDGEKPDGFDAWVDVIRSTIASAGLKYPIFLRTGQGSGKHDWKRTCHVSNPASLPLHIAALVEWSHLVDFFGLSHEVWVAREMLPTLHIATLDRYGNFPLVKELRAFIEGGKVLCTHPYWPLGSIRKGFSCPNASIARLLDRECRECDQVAKNLFETANPLNPTDEAEWRPIVEKVANAFAGDGAWSVDVLRTDRGWYVTDMAEAHRSFHYEGCAVARQLLDRAGEKSTTPDPEPGKVPSA